MATNDVVLLDGIIDQRVNDRLPSAKRDEVFEYFAFEQLLKNYDLSRDDLANGWVDGENDGGLDGFYTLVNGRVITDMDSLDWLRQNAHIDVFLIIVKHHATFKQAPLDTAYASLAELFNLALEKTEFKGTYSSPVLAARSWFQGIYRYLAPDSPSLRFHIIYASRGDCVELGESVLARAEQIQALFGNLFSASTVEFQFAGAAELIALYRKKKEFSFALPFREALSPSRDGYVLIVRLGDYFRFVIGDDGLLRRYLFDSNVRDYLGPNRVNQDIAATLHDPSAPEFWWLNNGVTILATNATLIGKALQIDNVQIVNGLQTTETLFEEFSVSDLPAAERRGVLVKVVVSSDPSVRDQIIRATNNQSLVGAMALHATDKIQRDIEEILERHDWYYERRENYYLNIGKAPARFVRPIFLAAGFVALVLRDPVMAGRLRPRNLQTPEANQLVFGDDVPLLVWVRITEILKRIEGALEKVRPAAGSGERFLSRNRNLLALICVARILGTFAYSIEQLLNFDLGLLSEEFILANWNRALEIHGIHKFFPGFKVIVAFAAEFGLSGIEMVGRPWVKQRLKRQKRRYHAPKEVVAMVNEALPEQPWSAGIHIDVAKRIGLRPSVVKGYSGVDSGRVSIRAARRRSLQRTSAIQLAPTTPPARPHRVSA